jgi:hypothetical protein
MSVPDPHQYHLTYRPSIYWYTPTALLANIEGEHRRRYVRHLLREKTEELTEPWLCESLSEADRTTLGRIHPMLMGGEYLPDYQPGEVEIARVALASLTVDVISIRARRRMRSIRYRVVDEYDTRFVCTPQQSLLPLTLGELISLIDGVQDPANDRVGLTDRFRNDNVFYGEVEPEEVADFVTVSSLFYPELQRYYEAEAKEWLLRQQEESREGGEDDET